MPTIKIDRFDGGVQTDLREQTSNGYAIVKHFNTRFPKKLIPYPKTEAVETKSLDIIKFLYADGTSSSKKLYGYGKATASTAAAVYTYDLDGETRGTTTWQTPANNEGSTTGRNEKVFFYYKDYLYMWSGGTKLGRFGTLSSSPTFTDSYQSITYTHIAQPVHHKADDIAYFASDNKIHTLNDTTWTSNALTLPNNLIITSMCQFGNFLAIGCSPKPKSANAVYDFHENSVVFLWDRDSSVTTLTESIDIGKGRLRYLAELDGQLIVVMDYFISNSLGLGESSMIIKNVAQPDIPLREILSDTVSAAFFDGVGQANSFTDGHRLYFPCSLSINGDTQTGIYFVDARGNIGIEIVEEEASSYEGIYRTAGTWWIAHSNDGSVNASDDNEAYTYTSIYESYIYTRGDSQQKKKLLATSVMTERLPSGGQVVLKYRKDEDINGGSWTTILTHSTQNALRKTAVNIESSGANLPEFNEIQFRLESTGGAVITGFKAKEVGIDDDIIKY